MSVFHWHSRILFSSVMSLLLLSACGVEIKAVRVNAEQLKNRELTEPGIYYYLPRTRLQLSLPVDYLRELVDRSDTQLGTCLAAATATCSGWGADGGKLARCQLLEKRERFIIHAPTISSYAVPDFKQLYRVEAKPLTPFQGVSHTVTFSAESPGVMTSSVAEGSDKSVEVLAAVVKAVFAFKVSNTDVSDRDSQPPPRIEWDETIIPCSDIRRLRDLRADLTKESDDKTITNAVAALATLTDPKYWGVVAPNSSFTAPLDALGKYMEQRQASVTALTAEITAIKVRNGIVSSTPKVSLVIPLTDKLHPDDDYLEPEDYKNYVGKEAKELAPASLNTDVELVATKPSLDVAARRQLRCRFESDPKKCLCIPPELLPQSICIDTKLTIAPLMIKASIESTGPDQNATQKESDAVGGYRYRVPIPARVTVHLSINESTEKILLKDQLVEIAQYGPVARLPHRFSGQKAGVELTLNKAGSPIRLKIGSEPAQTEPVTGLLDSISARSEQRRKERKEDEAKAAEVARKSEFEDLKLQADTLEQQIKLDKLRSGQSLD